MNWVGGARSRLKVPNERRLQRDYFERRRLSSKVNRAHPLGQRKAPISKDLLFLSKAASSTKTDALNNSPIRAAPKRVNLDSCAKQHLRDIELPMSPIEKPSTLELMDTSTVLSNSSLSLDQSVPFYQSSMDTIDLPRVSTLKVPHCTARNGFDFGTKGKISDNLLNVSCMTESLFPLGKLSHASTKIDPNVTEADQYKTEKRQNCKKYSIDDILNASQVKESLFPRPQTKTGSKIAAKVVPGHADALLWTRPGAVGKYMSRKRSSYGDDKSIPPKKRTTAVKENPGYSFKEWNAHAVKPSKAPKTKVDVVHSKDAMLEFHYAQKEGIVKEHNEIKAQNPPKVKKATDGLSFPWTKSPSPKKGTESTNSSLLPEDPFSNRMQYINDVYKDKQRQNYPDVFTDCESVLGPMEHTTHTVPQTDSSSSKHNITLFNESILGPIKDNQSKDERPKDSSSKKTAKKSTAFEHMMLSFEVQGAHNNDNNFRDVEDVMLGLGDMDKNVLAKQVIANQSSEAKVDREATKQHSMWKDFVSGRHLKSPEVKIKKASTKSDAVDTVEKGEHKPLVVTKLREQNKRRMSCSAFEELVYLEQEALFGLDNCSQDVTLSPLNWSEEPIMRRVPDMAYELCCPFDSSQESSLTNKSQSQYLCSFDNVSTDKASIQVLPFEQEVPLLSKSTLQPVISSQSLFLEGVPKSDVVNCTDEIECVAEIDPQCIVDKLPITDSTDVMQTSYATKDMSSLQEKMVPKDCDATLSNGTLVVQCTRTDETETTIEPHLCEKRVSATTFQDNLISTEQLEVPSTKVRDIRMDVSTQTSPCCIASTSATSLDSDVQTVTSINKSALEYYEKSTKDVCMQAGSSNKDVDMLQNKVESLQEELKIAESTMIWQSLMMKLRDIL